MRPHITGGNILHNQNEPVQGGLYQADGPAAVGMVAEGLRIRISVVKGMGDTCAHC